MDPLKIWVSSWESGARRLFQPALARWREWSKCVILGDVSPLSGCYAFTEGCFSTDLKLSVPDLCLDGSRMRIGLASVFLICPQWKLLQLSTVFMGPNDHAVKSGFVKNTPAIRGFLAVMS